jgi:hypothetical protein
MFAPLRFLRYLIADGSATLISYVIGYDAACPGRLDEMSGECRGFTATSLAILRSSVMSKRGGARTWAFGAAAM